MAVDELKTYQRCSRCGGDKKYLLPQEFGGVPVIIHDPCEICGGSGFEPIGRVDGSEHLDKILKRLKKIMQKIDAWEEDD